MLDVFTLHAEKKIGIKRLSNADLGFGDSHQTHIGLYGEVLSFLPDHSYTENGLFLYDKSFDIVMMHFDRITNPDGTTRSPKFRLGEAKVSSLVGRIRGITKDIVCDNWYLVWFGIDNGKVISILFNKESELYDLLERHEILKASSFKGVLSVIDESFPLLVGILQGWTYSVLHESLREMEISMLSQQSMSPKEFELNKVLNLSGRTSEVYQFALTHLSQYLEDQKKQGSILGFELLISPRNRFTSNVCSIIKKNGELKKMILKATEFDDTQPFMLNLEDLQLLKDSNPNFSIGIIRLFEIDKNGCMMQICSSLYRLISQLLNPTPILIDTILQINSPIKHIALEVTPIKNPASFSKIIKLP